MSQDPTVRVCAWCLTVPFLAGITLNTASAMIGSEKKFFRCRLEYTIACGSRCTATPGGNFTCDGETCMPNRSAVVKKPSWGPRPTQPGASFGPLQKSTAFRSAPRYSQRTKWCVPGVERSCISATSIGLRFGVT